MAAAALVVVVVAALLAGPGAGAGAQPAGAGSTAVTPSFPIADVLEHLERFQAIADANGGNRAAGSPGYAASVDYVADELEAAGFDVERQAFDVDVPVPAGPASFARTSPDPDTYAEGADYLLLAPPGAGGISGGLVPIGTASEGDVPGTASGCELGDYAGVARGSIVLVQLGGCAAESAVINALIAGAGGVVLASDPSAGPDPQPLAVQFIPPVPMITVASAVGTDLFARTEVGDVEVDLDTGYRTEARTTWNVVADLPAADPSAPVLVLGSHLDSMPTGPGINDPASGVAVLLELADELAASPHDQTIRIGLWGAEEEGLFGSQHYVGGLSAGERDRIEAYLNFDMIASPNYGLFVYDPDTARDPATVSPGSEELTERFRAWFAANGLPTEGTWSDGRSDDGAFAAAGIPVGGLFTGAEERKSEAQAALWGGTAGEAFDPCYHYACDTIANVSVEALTINAAAIEDVVLGLLTEPVGPAPDGPAATTPRAAPVPVVPAFTG